jgi:hypothetical protein
MFNGVERVGIATDVGEDEFHEHVIDSFAALGEVEISKQGEIFIMPKASVASFFSTVRIDGKISKTKQGYIVDVSYSVAPSQECWLVAVLAFFCVCMIGGGIILAPLLIDKPNVARAVQRALRDLKDSFEYEKRGAAKRKS